MKSKRDDYSFVETSFSFFFFFLLQGKYGTEKCLLQPSESDICLLTLLLLDSKENVEIVLKMKLSVGVRLFVHPSRRNIF